MPRGDRHNSDQVAVEAMRGVMDTLPIDGTIVIGEGERDEAPMLYIGEKVRMAHAKEGGGAAGGGPRARRARSGSTKWISPSIRSKAQTCAPSARRTPSPFSRRPRR